MYFAQAGLKLFRFSYALQMSSKEYLMVEMLDTHSILCIMLDTHSILCLMLDTHSLITPSIMLDTHSPSDQSRFRVSLESC